jgi:hypothetical protein|tara:strand:- start:287 stop:487 length:201 start_codon:yes stop_codon:yes gene_type:complete
MSNQGEVSTMDPSEIELNTTSKMFAYEKFARQIDQIDDLDTLRGIAKTQLKLYLKQQEVVGSMANM